MGDGTKKTRVNDDELDDLAKALLSATRDPISTHTMQLKVKNLEAVNMKLEEKVENLEKILEDRQITPLTEDEESMKESDTTNAIDENSNDDSSNSRKVDLLNETKALFNSKRKLYIDN